MWLGWAKISFLAYLDPIATLLYWTLLRSNHLIFFIFIFLQTTDFTEEKPFLYLPQMKIF